MLNAYLMGVPKDLITAIESGQAIISGGVVRSIKGGKILAHLEQINNLPLSDIFNLSNPLSPIFASVKIIQNQKMINQLSNITNTLNNLTSMVGKLQILSWANIALSGLNIGVSLVGFMMINNKLNEVNKKLDIISNKIDNLDKKVEALIINENRKLLRETKNNMDKALQYIDSLNEKGLTENLDDKLIDLKIEFRNLIEDLIFRYKNYELVGLPLELINSSFISYLNISKAHLTSKYNIGDKIKSPENDIIRIKENITSLENINYDYFSNNTEYMFTESQLTLIIKLFSEICRDNSLSVINHYEILSETPINKFKEWNSNIKLLSNEKNLVLIGH